ncbi:MAG: hypothetical protein ACRENI_01000 [Gemmatimonadaceae bacterium]
MRQFADETGTIWEVWEVDQAALQGVRNKQFATGFESGWLCFDSGREKRRLAPVPADWRALAEEELRELLVAASVVRAIGTPDTDDLPELPPER